jgi:hypothetical protein
MVTHRQRNKSLYTRTQTRRAAQKVIQLCHLETHGAAAVELLRRYETPGQACACLTSLAWCGHRIAIEIEGDQRSPLTLTRETQCHAMPNRIVAGLGKMVLHGCGTGKTLLGHIIAMSTSSPAYGQVRSTVLRSQHGGDR